MLRVLASVLSLSVLAACSGSQSSSTPSSTTITIAGSTALQPLVAKAAQDYMTAHPGVTVKVAGGGSGTGLASLLSNTVDVADSDVEAPAGNGSVDHQVAVVAFAVVVGPSVKVANLSSAQIRDIFSGKIRSWSALGGGSAPVVTINRPLNSGTRKVFTTLFMKGAEPAGTRDEDSSEKLAQIVRNTPGAISYVALSYASRYNLETVAIDGIKPDLKQIETGKYPFWSYEHMYTNAKSAAGAADFIAFVRGQNASIDQLGFIALSDMQLANR